MREYTVITVPQELLPQIVGELLSFAADANYVEVTHATAGRVIHAHPEVAEAWFRARQQIEAKEAVPVAEPEPPVAEPEPPAPPVVKALPPTPHKNITSPLNPNSEEHLR